MIPEAQIQSKICDILEAEFECPREKLTPDARLFEDLDLDSIDAVDLIVRLQQFTGKKVNPESFKQIRTLGDVVRAVAALVNEKPDA